jgi:rubrerythrin
VFALSFCGIDMTTMREHIRQREDRERKEAIELLQKQITVEAELVKLYKESEGEITSQAVKHLLHMIQLDSMKHIDICSIVIDVLQGEDVLMEEKKEMLTGLQRHIDLEQEALDQANQLLNNTWIDENKGLKDLIKTWRRDEKEHHRALKKLKGKTFFRRSRFDFVAKSTEELEERYLQFEKHSRKP